MNCERNEGGGKGFSLFNGFFYAFQSWTPTPHPKQKKKKKTRSAFYSVAAANPKWKVRS